MSSSSSFYGCLCLCLCLSQAVLAHKNCESELGILLPLIRTGILFLFYFYFIFNNFNTVQISCSQLCAMLRMSPRWKDDESSMIYSTFYFLLDVDQTPNHLLIYSFCLLLSHCRQTTALLPSCVWCDP